MYSSLNNPHQLIPRQQTYTLDKKILTIHSEDRDMLKWPFSNSFAIECPEVYMNVQTIRLVDIALPQTQDVFNTEYQNTKFSFKLIPRNPASVYYLALASNVNTTYIVTIQEGTYEATELAQELQNKLNKVINDYLITQGVFPEYLNFKVTYDSIGNTLYFGNTEDEFIFQFNMEMAYTLQQCEQPNVFQRCMQWGLPWYLGFGKQTYGSIPLLKSNGDSDIIFYYKDRLSPDYVWLVAGDPTPSYFLKAPLTLKIKGDVAIYLEIEKFNYMDELVPYVACTSSERNNYGGKVNSAFVKIPVTARTPVYVYDGINFFINNSGFYIPPIDKVSRLKFKFRYHDGRLVDFKDTPFTFSLELNQIRNDMDRSYSVKIPTFYNS
jgi:hypothetical protein